MQYDILLVYRLGSIRRKAARAPCARRYVLSETSFNADKTDVTSDAR